MANFMGEGLLERIGQDMNKHVLDINQTVQQNLSRDLSEHHYEIRSIYQPHLDALNRIEKLIWLYETPSIDKELNLHQRLTILEARLK